LNHQIVGLHVLRAGGWSIPLACSKAEAKAIRKIVWLARDEESMQWAVQPRLTRVMRRIDCVRKQRQTEHEALQRVGPKTWLAREMLKNPWIQSVMSMVSFSMLGLSYLFDRKAA
jgi:hypothetical protein